MKYVLILTFVCMLGASASSYEKTIRDAYARVGQANVEHNYDLSDSSNYYDSKDTLDYLKDTSNSVDDLVKSGTNRTMEVLNHGYNY